MEKNFVAKLIESNQRVKKMLENPLEVKIDPDVLSAYLHTASSTAVTTARTQPRSSIHAPNDSSTEMKGYLVAVSSVKLHVSEGMLTSSKFVVYVLTITNISNGSVHFVEHRFRNMKSFYYSLLLEIEDLEFNTAVKFPSYDDSWISNKQSNDPSSPLVQRRRDDLQIFFYQLFQQYPALFSHPKVISFLRLKGTPSLPAAVATPPTNSKPLQPSLQRKQNDINDFATDFNRGGFVDPGQSRPSTTLTEIMRFNDWFQTRCVEVK